MVSPLPAANAGFLLRILSAARLSCRHGTVGTRDMLVFGGLFWLNQEYDHLSLSKSELTGLIF